MNRYTLNHRIGLLVGGLACLLLARGPLAAQDSQAATEQPAGVQKRDLEVVKDGEETTPPVLGDGTVHVPRSYAVVIGVAEYPNLPPPKQLRFTERDADKIYAILISPRGGNFRAQNVHRLVGPKATLANIRHELEEWLPSVAKEGDRVLIYFAGHGFVFGGRAFLAPRDIDPNDIQSTGYPMETLGKVAGSRIQATYKVLITDACHSGAITPQADESQNQAVNRSLLDLSSSMFSLTASRDREQSFESPDWGGGHGIFTYYVVKGMEGEADDNGDGTVTADELAEYTRRNVREATNNRQTPTSDRGSFDPNLPLAYIPDTLAKVAAQKRQPEFGTLIFESNMDGVEIFLNGESAGVVNKDKPLKLPGLQPGPHSIKGVRMGYEPDGPREEMVYPGQEKTVTIKILYARRRNKAALDALDRGIKFYEKGFAKNYRQAAPHFETALRIDPTYSQAALYLGRTYSALFEYDDAEKAYRKALEIDPDYLEAGAAFGGMLLDTGDFDEAIRQLTRVVQRDPNHAMAQSMLAQSYRMKDMFAESIEAARKSIALEPKTAEPHFFLADSLRLLGDQQGDQKKFVDSRREYLEYLRLSDFESSTAEKVTSYWIRGFLIGGGKKRRATQKDIWQDLRSLAYFGLGDCERLLSHPDAAIEYYLKSLALDKEDPKVHWALALAFTKKAEITGSLDTLPQALEHFHNVVALNEHLAEADKAKQYIVKIDALLAQR